MHVLRHTFVTDLKENDVDGLIISLLLGHSSSDVTRRYIDTCFNELRRTAKALNQ
ncbi:MAG: site-specific integrase [Ruminococcaceae bacterium]|nr:site-specific integrase [Oscillospiraceae bacterium]